MMFNLIEKAKALEDLDTIHVPVGDQPGNLINRTHLDLNSVTDTLQTIIKVGLNVVVYLAALFFLYGAFMYIIAYGNEAKSGKAKQTMTWAVLGIAIAVLARLLVGVVVTEFSNNPNNANLVNQINEDATPKTTSPTAH